MLIHIKQCLLIVNHGANPFFNIASRKGGETCLIKPGLFACTGTWSTHPPVN